LPRPVGIPTIVPYGVMCFIINNTLINRLRSEGEARTRQAVDLAFHLLTYGALMINNTTHSLWDRLQQKSLNQQFTNRLIEGLNCSPFEANAILDTVYEVFAPHMDTSGQQGLGDIHILCTGIENSSAKPLKDANMVRVRLTLDGGEEDLTIRRAGGPVALRRHRMERMTHQAYQQGGCLRLRILLTGCLTAACERLCAICNTFESSLSSCHCARPSRTWAGVFHTEV